MVHQRIKNFWINKINGLITTYSLDPKTLTEGVNWDKKLTALQKWGEVGLYAKNICRDVYTKANQTVPNNFFTPDENYGDLLAAAFTDLETEFADKVNKLATVRQQIRTILGLASTDNMSNDWNTKLVKRADLDAANDTITRAQTYLGLGTKNLADVMDAGDPDNAINPHNDYLELPANTSLEDLVHWYNENDKLFDARAAGLEIFDYDQTNGNANAINLDLVENYAQAPNRLGLTDFSAATITAKLGTNKLSDIPTGKTLTDLLTGTGCPLAHCPPSHANYDTIKDTLKDYQDGFRQVLELNPTDPLPTDLQNLAALYNGKSDTQTVPQLKTKADHYDRIHTKLNGKVSDSELDTLLSQTPPPPNVLIRIMTLLRPNATN